MQGAHYFMRPIDIRGYSIAGKVADTNLIHLHTADEREIAMYLDDVNKNIVISNFKKYARREKSSSIPMLKVLQVPGNL